MTTLKLTTGEWLGVTVKEGAKNFGIVPSLPNDYLYFDDKHGHDGSCEKRLPPGSYSLPFPCVVGEMTDEQAGQVAESSLGDFKCYPDYEANEHHAVLYTATASLLSLCRANGLNPSTTILLKVNPVCAEKGCQSQAVKDYNGHGYMVCEKCYDSLNNYFDREYN